MYEELIKRLIELHPEEFGDAWDFAFACQRAMHEAADAIEELQSIIPHTCFCCIGCEVEPKDGRGCESGFVPSAERAKVYLEALSKMENTTDIPEQAEVEYE